MSAHHKGTASLAHETGECATSYCGRSSLQNKTAADVDSPLRPGVQHLIYAPEDMAVAVIIPGTAALTFRGQDSDTEHIAEWSRRDIEVAKTLLRDAINQLDRASLSPGPVPLPYQVPIAPPRAW